MGNGGFQGPLYGKVTSGASAATACGQLQRHLLLLEAYKTGSTSRGRLEYFGEGQASEPTKVSVFMVILVPRPRSSSDQSISRIVIKR